MKLLKLHITYNLIYYFLIILILLSGELITPAVSSFAGALLVTILILKFRKITAREFSLILPLILVFLIGVSGSVFQSIQGVQVNLYLFGKDIWYYIKPIIYLIAGYSIFRLRIDKDEYIRLLIYVSVCVAIIHIVRVSVFILTAEPQFLILDTIRAKTGPGNIMVAFSLAYLLTNRRIHRSAADSVKYFRIIVIILACSMILSFSRTLFLVFVLSVLAFYDFFSFRLNKFLKSLFIILFIFISGLLALLLMKRISDKESVVYALSEKYLNSLSELTYHTRYETFEEINRNWRGLETHMTKSEIRKGNAAERIIGFGFGKTVFIGYEGFLGKENAFIPKFHNGFIEIILKTGYLGLIFYLFFFLLSFGYADRRNPGNETDRFLKALIVASLFSTFIITGFYNKSVLDPVCLSIGFFMGFTFTGRSDSESTG